MLAMIIHTLMCNHCTNKYALLKESKFKYGKIN